MPRNRQWVSIPHYISAYRRSFAISIALRLRRPKLNVPTTPARTRFAPSPTGLLHLGSLRTALFNYLLAKKTGGQFLLRIEDTDAKRTVQDAEARLCEDLTWAGLAWDEGPLKGGPHGPYRQSERLHLYKDHALELLRSGHAYRCFCSIERLDDLARRRQALGLPTDYDRHCHGMSLEESDDRVSRGDPHVVRLLAPDIYPEFHDLVHGVVGKDKGANVGVTRKHGEVAFEDPVLLKTDGWPTYHLANVVDDHDMRITHVVRATEWMSSTPKHLALYRAFGWEPPIFAHVGLLVDVNGQKLSKRNLDTDVGAYRDKLGVLPSTLVNFVALLGWSHARRNDVMDLAELVQEFEMRFTKGNTTVTADKLWYLQRAHAARAAKLDNAELDEMVRQTQQYLALKGVTQSPTLVTLEKYIRQLLVLDAKNYEQPEQMFGRIEAFFLDPKHERFINKSSDPASTQAIRDAVDELFGNLKLQWRQDVLDRGIKDIIRRLASTGTKPAEMGEAANAVQDQTTYKTKERACSYAVYNYLRWVLFGGREGPSIAAAMEILGHDICRKRFEASDQAMQKVV